MNVLKSLALITIIAATLCWTPAVADSREAERRGERFSPYNRNSPPEPSAEGSSGPRK
ncbi:hypothetical protein F442_00326 [Phytophthora nicotianae P10297]|uniref:RxLR effector protein n=5 Tax=Phytophthora nicotianae TaxID=4792 RepID=V9G1X7_PHYNI|nr:hypothetical protein PPTG_20699 [Phytophthora nicotianae INRA-310]ETI30247.1 hypothetical protein F443_22634 [Phytophthora nicotianae P1569]ETK97109.1 hypothetical protein L915_00304 [Phytophthora nicotianae]ETO86092.1 hypothetical protein F444_00324 [Phytophthora nicotianae P1976]ETP55078.1 hypothetical protein F442_00326 [Phytophthora nicotianae P10297]ETI57346.1 hypothetical protein F443_00345 [Phytophthora nicotianae P1569]